MGSVRSDSRTHSLNPLEALTLDELRRRTSEKWHANEPDVLPLGVAEMDVPLATPVVQALTQALEAGNTGYTGPTSTPRYAQAFDHFARARWGWTGIREPLTCLVPAVMRGLAGLVRGLTRPGDTVVTDAPFYPPFKELVEACGRRFVAVPLGPGHRLDMDRLDSVFAAAARDSRQALYLLCSPQNPTGTVHTAEVLGRIADMTARHGVRVVADESHAPLVAGGVRFVPYLSVPGTQSALSVLSAAKAFNLGGLKAAVVVAGSGAADDLGRLETEEEYGRSHLAVIAHCAALYDGGPWLDSLLAGLDRNRRLARELLGHHLPKVPYEPADGTYFAWLDCRTLGLDSDPASSFLEHGRVALTPGGIFGTGGAGHARLNLATTPAILEEGIERMAMATGG
ncbi:MalY/PatB family protein [Streptomyces purpureus]|uniref:cysteine-S-conjugate beta-lyase n=1 Tax=Streptomyces purpureus TaxID=1951 RepID=A0A918LM04_9ACTN|nr:aminotransferase class I/II-fold pyridoxal phosphate-dependent enzyme [Streptomyces purpureus]GGT15775.1 cystathionine beta-lyase [Streptomyces purpureus]